MENSESKNPIIVYEGKNGRPKIKVVMKENYFKKSRQSQKPIDANRYPDTNDIITNALISNSPYPGYWEQSENCAFSFFERILKQSNPGIFLDLGCGQGRLLLKFAKYYKQAVALDCDRSRIDKAKAMLKNHRIKNIKFINDSFLKTDMKRDMFDAVVCSHVIQHINTGECSAFISKICNILKPGGTATILTNHSTKKRDFFVKSALENNVISEKEISENQFNEFIADKSNGLPIHYFTIDSLRKYFIGLRVRDIRVFHCLHANTVADKIVFRDTIANIPLIKNYSGRDVIVIISKLLTPVL